MPLAQSRLHSEPKIVQEWPEHPYKGLNFYSPSDRPLFGQRDEEIQICATLLGSFATKVLLVHGRSGTGKSSFLRAGLFPYLQHQSQQFTFLGRIDAPGEPYLLRCTDDPIQRLRNALLLALERDNNMTALSPSIKADAIAALDRVETNDCIHTAKMVFEALRLITSGLSTTLVIAIDQSEEVFTLGDGTDSAQKIKAYFQLLESLCFRRIDIRVVVALRTEYYGQLCDYFRILPNLSIATTRSGLDQFMLRGLQDSESLKAAISRPTLREPVADYSPPYSKYRFEYEPSLVEEMVKDILAHCGESSALPVMQLVCKNLYEMVVIQDGRRTITFSDYRRAGRVEGTIEGFASSAIYAGIHSVSRQLVTPDEVDKWKDVIATLVARQEGGTLTSLMIPLNQLAATARQLNVRSDPENCLRAFSTEDISLLRSVSRAASPDASPDQSYSLGHEALAPSLLQWRETREKTRQERRRVRRLKLIFAICFTSLLLVLLFVLGQIVLLRGQAIHSITAYARSEPTQNVRLRLLLLLSAWSNADGVARHLLPYREVKEHVQETISRAPVILRSALAAGVHPSGSSVALFGADRKVSILNLPMQRTGYRVEEQYIGTVPELANMATGPWSAVGFVDGIPEPMVYDGGSLFLWRNGRYETYNLDTGSMPGTTARPWVEFVAGVVRLTYWNQSDRKLFFRDLRYQQASGSFQSSNLVEFSLSSQSPLWPTFSDFSDKYARTSLPGSDEPGSDLLVGSRVTNFEWVVARLPRMEAETKDSRQIGFPATAGFLRPLAFANGDAALAIRVDKEMVWAFPLTSVEQTGRAAEPIKIRIPNVMHHPPIRPAWYISRPALAIARASSRWRVAWVSEAGVMIIDSRAEGADATTTPWTEPVAAPVRWPPPMLSAASLDGVTKLQFGSNPDLLITLEPKWGSETRVRIFDLSNERQDMLKGLSDKQIREEACRIAGQEPGSSELGEKERVTWPEIGSAQPCS